MQIKTFIINAFTDKPFTGNPAGICLIENEIDKSTMQAIAKELNLSETAFLRQSENTEQYNIRYFTPTVEIDFCGHATLAAAKLVLDKLRKDSVEFATSKNLKITATNQGDFIKMKFPIYKTVEYIPDEKLLNAFGIDQVIDSRYCNELDMPIIEVESKQVLLDIAPDFQKAIKSSTTIKELVVTTKSEDKEYDFYSRCFCPWIGIDEDPVTGASHSALAEYWEKRLHKMEMSAFQISKRGGFLELKILDKNNLEVRSNAQIIFEGVLNI